MSQPNICKCLPLICFGENEQIKQMNKQNTCLLTSHVHVVIFNSKHTAHVVWIQIHPFLSTLKGSTLGHDSLFLNDGNNVPPSIELFIDLRSKIHSSY